MQRKALVSSEALRNFPPLKLVDIRSPDAEYLLCDVACDGRRTGVEQGDTEGCFSMDSYIVKTLRDAPRTPLKTIIATSLKMRSANIDRLTEERSRTMAVG